MPNYIWAYMLYTFILILISFSYVCSQINLLLSSPINDELNWNALWK